MKSVLMRSYRGGWIIPFLLFAQLYAQSDCGTHSAMQHLMQSDPEIAALYASGRMLKTDTVPDSGSIWIIPVVVHLTSDNNSVQVPDSQVWAQIEALNETYGRTGLGFNQNALSRDAGIRFCLATTDPEGKPTNGIDRIYFEHADDYTYPEQEEALKKNSSWDPSHYLNVWVTGYIGMQNVSGTLEGYAYYPPGVAGTWKDGIVLTRKRFGLTGVADTSSYGKTLTHEIGHYLDLYHTWGDEDTCGGTDFIEDTPPCRGQYFNCTPTIQCDEQWRQIENYMDYSPDFCQHMFTRLQIQRMRSAILAYRPQLVSRENLVAKGCLGWQDYYPQTDSFSIYPNPSWSGAFYVYAGYADSSTLQIEVFDMLGQNVFTKSTEGLARGPVMVDLRGWRAGIYFVRLSRNESVWIRRVIIDY